MFFFPVEFIRICNDVVCVLMQLHSSGFLLTNQRLHEAHVTGVSRIVTSTEHSGWQKQHQRDDWFTKQPLSPSSFNRYFFGTCFVSGRVLSSGDMMVNQVHTVLSLMGLRSIAHVGTSTWGVARAGTEERARCVLSTQHGGKGGASCDEQRAHSYRGRAPGARR